MVSDVRKQLMAWMEMHYSKHMYFRWKVKWRLEDLGTLGIMGETAPLENLLHFLQRVGEFPRCLWSQLLICLLLELGKPVAVSCVLMGRNRINK